MPSRHCRWSSAIGPAVVALLLAGCVETSNAPVRFTTSNSPANDTQNPETAPAIAAETYQGTVSAITTNSRNIPRSFTLTTGEGPLAVNIPDILSDAFALTAREGDSVTAVVGTTATEEGKPAYLLLSFTAAGATFAVPASTARTFARVDGTIKGVIRDKRGIPISLLLSSGNIVRLDVRNTKAPEIELGEPFTAEGNALPLAKDRMIVQAVATNGLSLRVNLPPGGWGHRTDEGDAGDGGGEAMMDGGDAGGGE